MAGVAIYRRGAQADPANHQWQNYLSWALCVSLTPRLAKAGRRADAEAAAREGIGIAKAIVGDPGVDLGGYASRVSRSAALLQRLFRAVVLA